MVGRSITMNEKISKVDWNTNDIPDGEYIIEVEIEDDPGNTAQDAIDVTVDNETSRGFQYQVE